jgi:hypothetical protein
VSWAARLESAPDGLRLKFSEPVRELNLTADVARHLAALLAMAAEQRQPQPPLKGSRASRTTAQR